MADVDAAFVQQILHVPKRKRKPDVHHHRQADHLRAGFEVAKWAAFCHPPKLRGCPARLNQFCSDSAIPRKGGPAITKSDVLVINKTDLAPYVGASLDVMKRDAARMRSGKPFVMTSLRNDEGADAVLALICEIGGVTQKRQNASF